MLTSSPTSAIGQEFARVQQRSINLADLIADQIADVPPLETQFPDGNPLGGSLSMVARLIAAREALGMETSDIFRVSRRLGYAQ